MAQLKASGEQWMMATLLERERRTVVAMNAMPQAIRSGLEEPPCRAEGTASAKGDSSAHNQELIAALAQLRHERDAALAESAAQRDELERLRHACTGNARVASSTEVQTSPSRQKRTYEDKALGERMAALKASQRAFEACEADLLDSKRALVAVRATSIEELKEMHAREAEQRFQAHEAVLREYAATTIQAFELRRRARADYVARRA